MEDLVGELRTELLRREARRRLRLEKLREEIVLEQPTPPEDEVRAYAEAVGLHRDKSA